MPRAHGGRLGDCPTSLPWELLLLPRPCGFRHCRFVGSLAYSVEANSPRYSSVTFPQNVGGCRPLARQLRRYCRVRATTSTGSATTGRSYPHRRLHWSVVGVVRGRSESFVPKVSRVCLWLQQRIASAIPIGRKCRRLLGCVLRFGVPVITVAAVAVIPTCTLPLSSTEHRPICLAVVLLHAYIIAETALEKLSPELPVADLVGGARTPRGANSA